MYERGDDPMTAEEKKAFDAQKKEVAALKKEVAALTKAVNAVKVKYNAAGECPEYGQPTIDKLIAKGYLKGDKKGKLELTEQMIRELVILDRAKIFD
jgi:polyhydroxyalkanoate synthesis regulator phasin